MNEEELRTLWQVLAKETLEAAALKLYKDCFLPEAVKPMCSIEQALEKILLREDVWRVYAKNMFAKIDRLFDSIEKKQDRGPYEKS